MKLGLQLFGCMKLFREDPEAFLKEVRAMGYDFVEPCVAFGGLDTPFAWKYEDLPRYCELAHASGLSLDSCHAFARDFSSCVPEMRRAAETAGFSRFVVGWRGDVVREEVERFSDLCARTADELAKDGLELWLHNNAREISEKMDGVSAYETILNRCGGSLGAQVDTGWVVCGGEDLRSFLLRNEKYVRSIHHKDVRALTDEAGRTDNVALGAGIVDTDFAFRFARERGLGQIVDQDNSLVSLKDDLARSAEYLRSL